MPYLDGKHFTMPPAKKLPCGATAYYDVESSCHSYRCDSCLAVVGSIGMPSHCAELLRQSEIPAQNMDK